MKFKCPICGNDEHQKVQCAGETRVIRKGKYSSIIEEIPSRGLQDYYFNYERLGCSLERAKKPEIIPNFDAYICKKCGHVEMFALELYKRISDEIYDIENTKGLILIKDATLKSDINSMSQKLKCLEVRCEELEKLVKSKSITVGQQEEYNLELKEKTVKIRDMEKGIRELNGLLNYLPGLLKIIENRLPSVLESEPSEEVKKLLSNNYINDIEERRKKIIKSFD